MSKEMEILQLTITYFKLEQLLHLNLCNFFISQTHQLVVHLKEFKTSYSQITIAHLQEVSLSELTLTLEFEVNKIHER
jgi:hypothetical protein